MPPPERSWPGPPSSRRRAIGEDLPPLMLQRMEKCWDGDPSPTFPLNKLVPHLDLLICLRVRLICSYHGGSNAGEGNSQSNRRSNLGCKFRPTSSGGSELLVKPSVRVPFWKKAGTAQTNNCSDEKLGRNADFLVFLSLLPILSLLNKDRERIDKQVSHMENWCSSDLVDAVIERYKSLQVTLEINSCREKEEQMHPTSYRTCYLHSFNGFSGRHMNMPRRSTRISLQIMLHVVYAIFFLLGLIRRRRVRAPPWSFPRFSSEDISQN